MGRDLTVGLSAELVGQGPEVSEPGLPQTAEAAWSSSEQLEDQTPGLSWHGAEGIERVLGAARPLEDVFWHPRDPELREAHHLLGRVHPPVLGALLTPLLEDADQDACVAGLALAAVAEQLPPGELFDGRQHCTRLLQEPLELLQAPGEAVYLLLGTVAPLGLGGEGAPSADVELMRSQRNSRGEPAAGRCLKGPWLRKLTSVSPFWRPGKLQQARSVRQDGVGDRVGGLQLWSRLQGACSPRPGRL